MVGETKYCKYVRATVMYVQCVRACKISIKKIKNPEKNFEKVKGKLESYSQKEN